MSRAAGPFEIIEILGEGSFGTVCVARVTGDPLRRKVALKILKGAYVTNQKILNRTRDEARLLSRISHPNIVRVERLMDVGGRPVVVMECVQGVSLDQLLLRFKDGLPPSIAIEVMRQTCLALHVAYNETSTEDGRPMRVIHRDMKPSNIMLSIHGEVKVVDFGIAKGDFDGREAETESVVMGSRPYMAPERLDGISDSPAVDIYSTGVALFELLSGRTMTLSINPVNHGQAMGRQLQHLRVDGVDEQGQEDVRQLIAHMCAYDRDSRPTALAVARDLEQILFLLDADMRIGLDEFARTTVLPIYESRPRISPEDATTDDTMESEFLREVTGQLTGSHPIGARRPLLAWTPYVFVGVLFIVVLVLVVASVMKLIGQNGAGDAPTEVAVEEPADGRVKVNLWIPNGAWVSTGGFDLMTPGHVRVYPGPNLAQLSLESGLMLNCKYNAAEGLDVRYVGDNAISLDDGPATPCEVVQGAAELPTVPVATEGAPGSTAP